MLSHEDTQWVQDVLDMVREVEYAKEYADPHKFVAFQLRRLNELIDAYGMKMALDWFLAEG